MNSPHLTAARGRMSKVQQLEYMHAIDTYIRIHKYYIRTYIRVYTNHMHSTHHMCMDVLELSGPRSPTVQRMEHYC